MLSIAKVCLILQSLFFHKGNVLLGNTLTVLFVLSIMIHCFLKKQSVLHFQNESESQHVQPPKPYLSKAIKYAWPL